MNYLVLGSGLMGKEAARDLVNSGGTNRVTLADVDEGKALSAAEQIGSEKLEARQIDAGDEKRLQKLMEEHDVVLNALYYAFNETVAKAAIRAGVHSVDLGGHIGHITDRVLDLDEEAKKAGVTIIPDLGVAPGMINILTGYGASKLDEVKSVKLYVGGIPLRPEPPLGYNHVFSLEGLFDHYTDPSLIIRGGHNIDPLVIEEVLNRHPAVETAAAVGRPDAYAGELPMGFVQLRPGQSATPEELVQFCRENVTERAAAPVEVQIIETMPLTGVGKIFKPALRRAAVQLIVEREIAALQVKASVDVVIDPAQGIVARVALADGEKETAAEAIRGRLDSYTFKWELR